MGGQLIYHGPTEGAEPYFNRRNYLLPLGESVADWLIDISSGRLEPENQVAEIKKENLMAHTTVNGDGTKELYIRPSHQESTDERKDESVETKAIASDKPWSTSTNTFIDEDVVGEGILKLTTPLPVGIPAGIPFGIGNGLGSVDKIKYLYESDSGVSAARLNSAGRVVTDGNCVGKRGVTTGKVVQ